MDAIHIANLRFRYPPSIPEGPWISALCGVDLAIRSGESVALMGAVGSGKTTLCLALNGAIPHAVDGEMEGSVVVLGQDTRTVTMGRVAMQIGLVFENAEAQLFNATVADEIAFGLESQGLSAGEIERRIDDALDLVDLVGFRRRNPRTLSGGEQKRLALACVLAMRPRILVLDEPTAGLDAWGRRGLLTAIERLKVEQGEMTVVMATQDGQAAAQFADRVVILQQGHVVLSSPPATAFSRVTELAEWGIDVPQLARLAERLSRPTVFTPEDAVQRWTDLPKPHESRPRAKSHPPTSAQPMIEIHDLCYEYPQEPEAALHHLSMTVARGEWLAVIGVNGSGKTTLIKHLNGLLRPSQGTVHVAGLDSRAHQIGELARLVSYLPQNPDHSIFCATVKEEIAYGPRQLGLKGEALENCVQEALQDLDLGEYGIYPPAVLGYGLRRQVALASILAMKAPVLALDEPTTGLDRGAIARLMEIVLERHRKGTTVVMISHDLQLVAQYAQRVVVLQQGHLVAEGPTRDVLSDVELVSSVGLTPLPITSLAKRLDWPQPYPLNIDDWETYV
jgi:energy-coupling factor transport system ATP-binding protein